MGSAGRLRHDVVGVGGLSRSKAIPIVAVMELLLHFLSLFSELLLVFVPQLAVPLFFLELLDLFFGEAVEFFLPLASLVVRRWHRRCALLEGATAN